MSSRTIRTALAAVIALAVLSPSSEAGAGVDDGFVQLAGSQQSSGNHRAEQVAVDAGNRTWFASVDRTVAQGGTADRACGRPRDSRGCGRIGRISPTGAVTFFADAAGGPDMRRPLAVATSGQSAFVADLTGHVIWHVPNGALRARDFARLYAFNDPMVFPTDLAVRGDNLFFLASRYTGDDVADRRAAVGRIGRIHIPTGRVRVWRVPGLRDLAGMAFDASGRLWFSGNGIVSNNHDVGVGFGRLNPASTNPPVVFAQSQFVGDRFISAPSEMITGPDDQLWFVDNGTSQVGRFQPANPTGTLEFLTPTGDNVADTCDPHPDGYMCGGRLYDLTTGPGGDVFYSRSRADQIGRITTAGVVTSVTPPIDEFDQPYGLAQRGNQLMVAIPSKYRVGWYVP